MHDGRIAIEIRPDLRGKLRRGQFRKLADRRAHRDSSTPEYTIVLWDLLTRVNGDFTHGRHTTCNGIMLAMTTEGGELKSE